jgi:hypothetical protein
LRTPVFNLRTPVFYLRSPAFNLCAPVFNWRAIAKDFHKAANNLCGGVKIFRARAANLRGAARVGVDVRAIL